jgi:RDD family protein
MPAAATCPLCNLPLGGSDKLLYNHRVCDKCHQDFALRRVLANFLDQMVLSFVGFILGFAIIIAAAIIGGVAGAATGNEDFGGRLAVFVWVLMLLVVAFFAIAKDGFGGYSPVKYVLGLQVIDSVTGRPAGFLDAFKRNLNLNIPFMPLYVLIQLMTKDGIRMGDGWARTKVIWKKYGDLDPFLPLNELRKRTRERAAAAAAAALPPKA